PPDSVSFDLDVSTLATFFGSDAAITAMATLHLDPARRWLGWYNTPGARDVAKHYGRVTNSRIFRRLFPG
ncbi:hypothetical protein J3A83DRAFT_4082602, partial [Scleroderma citrinum]